MASILRYDRIATVYTPLNPIEDVMSWISGLKSSQYNADVLRQKHNFTRKEEINKCSRLILTFAENSIGLLEQAYSGPADMSFLPLYYAILNLSKIYIVLSGKGVDLEKIRHHGASYNPNGKHSRDLIFEEITLKSAGVFPAFYNTLTGITKSFQRNKKVALNEIYPYIGGISHEFHNAYGKPFGFRPIELAVSGSPTDGYRITASLLHHNSDNPNSRNKKYLKIIEGFHVDPNDPNNFVSKKITASTEDEARNLLLRNFRRYLLYHPMQGDFGKLIAMTPISNRRFLLPEEVPIWLSFFHLSNIVRYNPEFLAKLKDSKAWPMLLALRRHAVLNFMLLFWSYLHQTTYTVSVR